MKKRIYVEVIRALFIFLFVYTALNKIIDFHIFQGVLKGSPLLGKASKIAAIAILGTELAIAILLVIPVTKRTGLVASFILMLCFSGYIVYMMMFSSHLPCSCGGILKTLNWREHLVLNILLSIGAAIAIVFDTKTNKPSFAANIK